ncbi:cadmium-translocating P-type ATPase [Aliarcobacter butzleri]|uniref:heavy metal translocating P-type ATPase n=1 Tax=Aliarcobacter butzleri TaxID=28197 RepID=UPI001EE0D5B4|nr:heavy metal translocating P-type ATPase [Aliarcobacter butzleri]MCG3675006.1 cadmium-translocating P-type ATPase [Aliarcobacter butzleri]MCG3697952.1 cadmium-translocating P-type ATPase [Aliarcobacter butzleri]MDN5080490.1 heavy metal translocating P-type ATPase [Aliarcobacter butzleri]MDN5083004.1 heavy metal translocating P-type ATPase [Aliarcobacter butzleri]MDN5085084.1 heavy metal translocating P-type ATPase [Aliarcobacter butzleri]
MKKVKLQNLDCASCALKIEKSLANMEELSNVKLNFSTSTLTFEQNTKKDILDKIEKEIQKIEKDVIILKDEIKTQKTFWQNLDKKLLIITLISFFLTYISYNYIENNYLKFTVYLVAYLLVGFDVLSKAFKNLTNARFFDENFLMSIATIGAFVLGDFVEGIAVMVFYQIGEMFQKVAVNNSRDSINSLLDIKPEYANVKEGDNVIQKAPEDVKIGDIILVKAGEKVPVDGILQSNDCSFDTSAITGEFKPKTIKENEEVLSGFINISTASYVKVTSLYKDSTIAKIIELIENASSKKANAEKFITKFASVYTPIVIALALILAFIPPLFIEGAIYSDWIERALVFLVISCPCALVVSIPLSFFSAIGAVSKKGVLVKGANYIEKLTEIQEIIFDKTGTLTKGVFQVTRVESFNLDENELLEYAALVESFSTHPIAKAIVNAYDKELNLKEVSFCEELSGLGIKAKIKNKDILVGNERLLKQFGVEVRKEIKEELNIVYIAIDSKFEGFIVVSDIIKNEAKDFINELKKINISKTYMLTGDKKEVALKVANDLQIDEVKYELLPQDKLKSYEEIKNKTEKITAFVGDGINDAPTLANSDVGFAMGKVGSDLAIKSADIVVLNDNLNSISDAIKIAKKTKTIVYQNIIFIMFIKVIFLVLGADAIIGMKEAIFADMGVALIAIFNSMRILKTIEEKPKKDSFCSYKKS